MIALRLARTAALSLTKCSCCRFRGFSTEEQEAPSTSEDKVEPTPEEEIAELKNSLKSLGDQNLRLVAEMDNVRKIAKRDVEIARTYAIDGFSKKLLDIADNLNRALSSVAEEEIEKSASLKGLFDGVALTEAELDKAFLSSGIKKFGEIGDSFDPRIHEAMFQYADPELEPGTVGQVIRTGYFLHERVLRPAQVGTIKE